jgi:Pyruvate/2-oxoacid:ferredoxin oxidoreductase delta subunit
MQSMQYNMSFVSLILNEIEYNTQRPSMNYRKQTALSICVQFCQLPHHSVIIASSERMNHPPTRCGANQQSLP